MAVEVYSIKLLGGVTGSLNATGQELVGGVFSIAMAASVSMPRTAYFCFASK